ncbi:methionyl-tRNA formyltransferase [Desulfurispira natronophila]|uniref:Methionyl-tRNA formyltransferase n=1 Tax=Desulfurispira natronophila TaxID=682562 RepID=A0A7W7Y4F4_9BACT|nr:methionyl-tRNA formyltransferase [Desulfurispira natronophila]MBB5021844.1 methionyl-tRNA formyltransferase [Desulfurispira natronophila]
MSHYRVGFMGTPPFSVPALDAVLERYQVPVVITQPDRPVGRKLRLTPSAVKKRALEAGVPVLTPSRVRGNNELFAQVRQLELDAMVVVAYGHILPQEFLDIPRVGCYNIHASLLPRLRGAAPIQRAILEGHQETGITIIRMDAGLDTGDMVLQKSTAIGDMDSAQLHDALSQLGAQAISESLAAIFAGTASLTPQNHDDSTYAAKLRKDEGVIDWRCDADAIWRQVRALCPWPGTTATLASRTLKVRSVQRANGQGSPGTILAIDERGMEVACRHGSIVITQIQPPGKPSMAANSFAHGYGVHIGERFDLTVTPLV